MRVLCIEDAEPKFHAISNVLVSAFGAEVHWVRKVSASLGLLGQKWDLIVLDMNFPSAGQMGREREHGRQETSGIKVLQVMSAQDIKVPVIIATAHDSFGDNRDLKIKGIDDLTKYLAFAFPNAFKGVLKVDFAREDWHETLIAMVRETSLAHRD